MKYTCPLNQKEFTDKCCHTDCWYNIDKHASGCARLACPREIYLSDCGYFLDLTPFRARKNLELGREKIKIWLKIHDLISNSKPFKYSCPSCGVQKEGNYKCLNVKKCENRQAKQARFRSNKLVRNSYVYIPSQCIYAIARLPIEELRKVKLGYLKSLIKQEK